jgi:hypothetical protein
MAELLNEYQIVQNEVLGAHALWEFAKYYNEYNLRKSNPELMLSFPVLPIVFNKRATKAINGRNFKEGSLYRTINENKDIYTGLQDRMENMAPLTFKSLSTAFSLRLLGFDNELSQIVPFSKTFPLKDVNVEYQEIIHSSRRVGAWFGQLDYSEISVYFNIHF